MNEFSEIKFKIIKIWIIRMIEIDQVIMINQIYKILVSLQIPSDRQHKMSLTNRFKGKLTLI